MFVDEYGLRVLLHVCACLFALVCVCVCACMFVVYARVCLRVFLYVCV